MFTKPDHINAWRKIEDDDINQWFVKLALYINAKMSHATRAAIG